MFLTTIILNECSRKVKKEFSKAERVEYGRRLERIEAAKAEKRMKSGAKNPVQNSAQGSTTRDIVSDQLGISHDTYIREKTIVDNRNLISVEDFEKQKSECLRDGKGVENFPPLKSRDAVAEERMKAGKKDPMEIFPQGTRMDIVENFPQSSERRKLRDGQEKI